MPIKACADKLKREMKTFGFPPKFPVSAVEAEPEETTKADAVARDKSKGKKVTLCAVIMTGRCGKAPLFPPHFLVVTNLALLSILYFVLQMLL